MALENLQLATECRVAGLDPGATFWLDGVRESVAAVTRTFRHGITGVFAGVYSATLDELERPSQIQYFTASLAEWVSLFPLDHRPTLVGHVPVSTQQPINVGVETVQWFSHTFGLSQEMACRVLRISTATYYMWKKRPETAVRPSTVKYALRLRVAIETLVAESGPLAAVSLLSEGDPSPIDKLLHSGTWEDGLADVKRFAEPHRRTEVHRFMDVSDYLRDLDELSARADDADAISARQMTPEQIDEAVKWGWGQRPDEL